MFSIQSNWKLSANILPWDERQIKLSLALVWLQTKKGQARESPKYKSDRYLFSDFESREVSHPCFKKRTGSVFSFLAEYQCIICWYCNRFEHRLFLEPCEIYGTLSVRKEKFQKQSCPSGNKKNGESFWVKLKLKTIILSRNVVNINNKISHDKCNSRQCLPTTPWNCPRFKQEKNCDSELFCTNSLSLHLERIKMSLSKLKFKGRVIWTEKCGLTFTFYIGYHNFLHGSTKIWNPETETETETE